MITNEPKRLLANCLLTIIGIMTLTCFPLRSSKKSYTLAHVHFEEHKGSYILRTSSSAASSTSSSSNGVSTTRRIPTVPSTPRESHAGARQAVFGGRSSLADQSPSQMKAPRYSKDSTSRKLIQNAIQTNDFLKNLDNIQIQAVVDAMYIKELHGDSFLIQEGEIGTHLYVSAEGKFEIIKGGVVLGQFGPGVTFGELAILYNCKRKASIRVLVDSKVWVLDRKVFQRIMMSTGLQKIEDNVHFLRSVPLLQNLKDIVLKKIADLLRVEYFDADRVIIRQGDEGNTFYIISGGTVEITKKQPGSDQEEKIGVLGRGEYFGDLALIKADRRQATVTALAPGVECLVLDREHFIEYLGDLEEIRVKDWEATFRRPTSAAVPTIEYDYIAMKDLDVIATLGVGGFGRVELVHYRSGKLTFALKSLKKVHVVEQQQQQHAYSEKAAMLECKDCPFISRLYRTYRDSKYIYFLMEACLGGDVFTMLQKYRLFDEATSRFMAACVVEALEFLHKRGFIYRDLKPENLLLDRRGYIKMIDFGFAKKLPPSAKTWTFAGTPEYVAPEIILNLGHDRAVDCWALGILIHELLTGRPPFRGSDHMKTYNMILKGIDSVSFPQHVSAPAKSIIKKLCRNGATERLGCQKKGIEDIKYHRWFHNFNWDELRRGTLRAPIIPQVNGPLDTRNFDKYPRDKDVPPDELSGWDKDF
ncbi:cGMP-dependent protein kinase, isozyme 1 isoform X3 [Anabrus simplex]|uniref:cGMP-dependent protein kinase, isozyme 1 isoform X3 n=2 Tax=Anabrus simplex TaxID=316456 RepID=UPI0035A2C497